MPLENEITKYQRKVWKEYKQAVSIASNYAFLYGNPIKVHVPIDTAINGLMIIGAYPTAHFNVINGVRDVPVNDHLYPFSNELYFDGSSVNTVKSGRDIEEYFLNNLGYTRSQCWITDLVKVFLFKPGHVKKYETLGYKSHRETRSLFRLLGEKSRHYIDEEILLANPKAILGLGAEVNSIMLDISEKEATAKMNEAMPVEYKVEGEGFIYFPVPHPGILMRNTAGSVKWKAVLDNSINKIKSYI